MRSTTGQERGERSAREGEGLGARWTYSPTVSTLNRSLVVWLAVVMMLLGGCKKTLEGQQSAWKANVARVDALMAKYPGFEPALTQRLTAAKTVHAKAEGLTGQEQIDTLSAANSALMKGFVGKMGKLDSMMKELRGKRVEVAAKAGDESSRLGAKMAAQDAQKALDRAHKALAAGAKDEASATAVIGTVIDDLKTADKALDKVLAADRDKKDAKAAQSKAAADEAAKVKAEAEAKVARWSCEYCGSHNPHTEGSCKSCGAPRGKSKDAANKK